MPDYSYEKAAENNTDKPRLFVRTHIVDGCCRMLVCGDSSPIDLNS